MDHNTINNAVCAAPATDELAPKQAATDDVASSAPGVLLLVIMLLALAGSLRVTAMRARR
jgi:hypothetical protein